MFISRQHLGLLLMAILSGVATAAGIVVAMAMRSTAKASTVSLSPVARSGDRPSPFGRKAPVMASPETIPKSNVSASAVVTVTGYDSNDQPLSRANGYIYSTNGIVVTSYSAIRGASSVTIETSRGEELTVIALMGYSPTRDLAALAVLEGNLPALQNGAEETSQEGEAVSVLAFNGGVAQGTLGPRRAIAGVDLIGINLQATPGSPLINRHGKVIGLVSRRNGGLFAIPSHYVSDMLAESHAMSFGQMLEETGRAANIR